MSDGAAPGAGLTLLGRSTPSLVFELLHAAVEGHEGPKLETVGAEPGLVEAEAVIECLVSWCPVTYQIDYYQPITIRYAPQGKLVESKSLKLYGEWFLTRAIFAESLALEIAKDIYEVSGARWVIVEAHQAVRGGIRLAGRARLPVGPASAEPPDEEAAVTVRPGGGQ
jgi:7-cyano-7-deazaguanine reductase